MAPASEEVSAAAGTKWAPAFEAVLVGILADYEGMDAKSREGMESGMRKLFELPYQAEFVPSGPELDLETAQRIIFFPTPSDMARYVEVFARETPEKTARRERLLKFKLLSVFYTLHRKDSALVERFVHLGGLCSLTALLVEDHPVVQSQGIEMLAEMISPLMQSSGGSSSRQAHLLHQVHRCLHDPALWRNTAAILVVPHEIFPNSHAACLKILAGAIAWLRPATAAGEAAEPRQPLHTGDLLESLQQFLDGDGYKATSLEFRGLADELAEELRKGSPACRPDPLGDAADLAAAHEAVLAPTVVVRDDAAQAWQALRRLGNAAFKKGLALPAEATYQLALVEGEAAGMSAVDASLIESNRALALLKASRPSDAALVAEAALRKDPRNAKAAYRRAQALLEVATAPGADAAPAARAAHDAVAAAKLAEILEPGDAKVVELLGRARQRAEELGPCPADVVEDAALEDMD